MRPDPDLTTPDQEANRWEQQPGETDRAYLVFAVYRDLGPLRTLRRAAAGFYHSHPELTDEQRLAALTVPQLQQAKHWSRANDWVARTAAWDHHLDEISRSEQEVHARTMRNSYRVLSSNLRNRVAVSMNAWVEEKRTLTPTEAIRALEVAQRIEAWSLEIPADVAVARGAEKDQDAEELAQVGRDLVAELRLVEGGKA